MLPATEAPSQRRVACRDRWQMGVRLWHSLTATAAGDRHAGSRSTASDAPCDGLEAASRCVTVVVCGRSDDVPRGRSGKRLAAQRKKSPERNKAQLLGAGGGRAAAWAVQSSRLSGLGWLCVPVVAICERLAVLDEACLGCGTRCWRMTRREVK